jgi:hypothetical protein
MTKHGNKRRRPVLCVLQRFQFNRFASLYFYCRTSDAVYDDVCIKFECYENEEFNAYEECCYGAYLYEPMIPVIIACVAQILNWLWQPD